MSRPAELLLVHGAWHGSWAFDDFAAVLTERGWVTRTVDLDSTGSVQADVHDDAVVVRRSLDAHPAPTIVVGHSYGGYVVSEGAAGARNVVGTVYLCAGMPDVGEPVWTDYEDPQQVAPWITVDTEARVTIPRDAGAVFYADCLPEVAEESARRLRPQSLRSFMTPVTGAAWRQAPSAYLICDEDKCLLPAVQETLAGRADYVEHIAASHSPFLSQPRAVAQFIESASARF
jgi:pimeloyl-ACP methyl ester carboxylesterase